MNRMLMRTLTGGGHLRFWYCVVWPTYQTEHSIVRRQKHRGGNQVSPDTLLGSNVPLWHHPDLQKCKSSYNSLRGLIGFCRLGCILDKQYATHATQYTTHNRSMPHPIHKMPHMACTIPHTTLNAPHATPIKPHTICHTQH